MSHTGADKIWVRRLAEQLESETLDGTEEGRRLRVFFDEWDIEPGENLVLKIDQGLRQARFVAVVVSPALLDADWPALEWTSVLASDPANRAGRLIPLYLSDGSEAVGDPVVLPAPFRVLKWLDFRDRQRYRQSFRKLVQRIRSQPPERGRRRSPLAALPPPAAAIPSAETDMPSEPDRVHEVILGNLLPVEGYPGTVWSGDTSARTAAEVFDSTESPPAFLLQEKRLYTFADLSVDTDPLAGLVDASSVHGEAVSMWADDPVRWRWFVSLLNKSLRNHFRGLPIRQDGKQRFFFLPDGGATRTWANPGDRPREVAAKKIGLSTGVEFWVHQAAWMQFTTLGHRLFLQIDPCYMFTSDGLRPLEGRAVGPLSMNWTGRERNASILRHVVFWARTLAAGRAKARIRTGANPIIVSGVPALARTRRGVEFDHINFAALSRQVHDELSIVAASVLVESATAIEQPDSCQHSDDESAS